MTDSSRHRSATIRPIHHDATIRPLRPTSPTATSGFRAHLAHLLPRHAAFTVTVTIHQLNNVPLVAGEFGLKWKVKGVTSHAGNGILDKVKARKAKAKPRPALHRNESDNASQLSSDAHSAAHSSSTNDHAHAHTRPIPIPSVVVSATPPPVVRSVSGTSSLASVGSASSLSSVSPRCFAHNFLTADWSRQAHDRDTISSRPNGDPHTPPKLDYSPAKGITPFVRLREHHVDWEKTLKFVVQMSVGRDTGDLGDCLAKFVVMQRVITGDPDAPRNPRLGAVHLNLAQYVDAGVVTRRYLLRQSKTNATLKLTIYLEHTAGESIYVAPPLPKGEILSGVAGILESSDLYHIRSRAPDSSSDDDAASGSDVSSVVSESGRSNPVSSHGHTDGHRPVKKHRRPFQVSKLPMINDPRGTEKLIEALFNPVPVTQPSKVTPFTYLVEVNGEGDVDADAERDVHGEDEDRCDVAGPAPEADDDGSLYTDSPDESAGDAGGIGSEYHSLRSHPSLQGSLRSKCSTRSLASKVDEDGGDEAAPDTGVPLLLNGVTERRTWWRKVLSPPAAG